MKIAVVGWFTKKKRNYYRISRWKRKRGDEDPGGGKHTKRNGGSTGKGGGERTLFQTKRPGSYPDTESIARHSWEGVPQG